MTETTTANVLRPYVYGRGYPTVNTSLAPAVGAASILKVPGNRNFRINSITGHIQTSAVVANRTVLVQFLTADSTAYCTMPVHDTVGASGLTRFQFSQQITSPYQGGDGTRMAPLPEIIVPAGHIIQVTAVALDAGDQITDIAWLYDEFVIGGGGYPQGMESADVPMIEP